MKKRIICAIALLSFGLAFSQETTSKILGRLKGSGSEVTVKVTHLPTNSTFETKATTKEYSVWITFSLAYKIEITEGSNIIYSNSNLQLSLGNNDLPVVEVNSSKEKQLTK